MAAGNRFNRNYPHVSQDVYDYSRKKLCNLYDSSQDAEGQAHDIVLTNEQSGWKELEFVQPYTIDSKKNFRWNFIKNEYWLRVLVGDKTDWFIIHSPKKTKSRKTISNTVTCSHISSILKTKNLYMSFDDTNGIGTIQYQMEQILKGTGWKLGACDTIYERDGYTEKIRSLQTDGKDGAYQLIIDVCNLFKCYPIFDGETKTVEIRALNDRREIYEMTMGKDIESLSVEYNSEDIITRLYVEGEYGEHAYVGIDDVNPTGLSYLMNFDYYKSIGVFTEEHQKLLDDYYAKMKETIEQIKSVIGQINEEENKQNVLWGQCSYMFYEIKNKAVSRKIIGNEVDKEDQDIKEGDKLVVIQSDQKYREEKAGVNGQVNFLTTDLYAIKFVTASSGEIGARETAVDTKRKLIKRNSESIEQLTTDEKKQELEEQNAKLTQEVTDLFEGTEESQGLYAQMWQAVQSVLKLSELNATREEALNNQDEIEAEFAAGMGDMLKEGYWNNTNYALGQEQFLYEDAVDMMEQMSKPIATYSVSRVSLVGLLEERGFNLELNSQIRIYDSDQGLNDFAFISKTESHLDKPEEDTVEISNNDITLTGLSMDSILSRLAQLADLIEQKNTLFERSDAIEGDGSIYMERLEGAIDVLKNRLQSSTSSWYTDDHGNIMFVSTSGKSAMMLCGEGFMIANGKDEDGEWNWRTFGTGEGFCADMQITGFLSADRIEARSITVEKLESGVGAQIDLSENNAIKMLVESVRQNRIWRGPTPPDNPQKDDLWLDTSNPERDILKRWNGKAWVSTALSDDEIQDMFDTFDKDMIHRGPLPPEHPEQDDLWLDTSGVNGDVLKRWDGTKWVETSLNANDLADMYDMLDKNMIYKGPTPPEDPDIGMLWIDTSNEDMNSLKRWTGTEWIPVSITPELLAALSNRVKECESAIVQLDNSIKMTVSQTTYAADKKAQEQKDNNQQGQMDDLNGGLDALDEERKKIETRVSELELTANDLTISFTTTKTTAEDAAKGLDDFKETVCSWQQFSEDGLTLGRSDSALKARQSNSKLSFYDNNNEVSYISDSSMYITNARVTQMLSIGTVNNGYFDFVTGPNGLALQWRDPS